MIEIILQWKDTRGMQVGITIGNESDGHRLPVGGYSEVQLGIDFGSESDGYRLTVGGYSGDAGMY